MEKQTNELASRFTTTQLEEELERRKPKMKLKPSRSLRTLKDFIWKETNLVSVKAIRAEAIKWVKEDLEYLKIAPQDDATQIASKIIINIWMNRLNITEENLK